MEYNGVTILQFFTQLQKWFVISNGDNLKMREYFHAPWTDTPYAHTSTYAAQLDERQLECVDFEVDISDAAKKSSSSARCRKADSSSQIS